MTTNERSTVVGVFSDPNDARQAINALKENGFSGDAISVLAPDSGDARQMAEETGTQAASGVATGAVAGGVLGGLTGWLVGIGALAIPGVGPFIAAGAFATAIGGAAIGASVGAIAGALVSMGIPEEHAKYYEGEVRSGRTLVTVRAEGRYDEAQRLLRQYGAYDVESRGQDGTGQTVQLREEELQARKQSVQTGEVSVGKQVVTEQRTISVPVQREELVIERHAVDGQAASGSIDDRGERITVPLHEDQVEVKKQPVVYEEVGVGKRQVQETREVSDTVRREEARIDADGNVQLEPAPGARQ